MTPAERLAALKALEAAIKDAIDAARHDMQELMQETGADRYRNELATVSLARGRDRIIFDEDQLLKFAQATDLDGVELSVRPTFRELFKIIDDEVIFTPTGEAVDFATVRSGSEYVTTRLSDGAKDRAHELLAARAVPELLTGE